LTRQTVAKHVMVIEEEFIVYIHLLSCNMRPIYEPDWILSSRHCLST